MINIVHVRCCRDLVSENDEIIIKLDGICNNTHWYYGEDENRHMVFSDFDNNPVFEITYFDQPLED